MQVRLYDLAFLLQCVERSKNVPQVAHLDADHTNKELRHAMNKEVYVPTAVIESALSYFQELKELDLVEHPDGLSAAGLARKISGDLAYDKTYRVFAKKGRK